jgi:hypothetical protein
MKLFEDCSLASLFRLISGYQVGRQGFGGEKPNFHLLGGSSVNVTQAPLYFQHSLMPSIMIFMLI